MSDGRVVVVNHVTLDGVMQGPGDPDEDRRGGFTRGGWAADHNDGALVHAVGERMGTPNVGLLLGRISYEGMLSGWNARGGTFKDALNAMPKYVASASPQTALDWPNSTLLHGDLPSAVAELTRQRDGNLVIMGSGQLIRSLLPHDLIDELLLMVHPLVLGSGLRLFGEGDIARLRLLDSQATTTGVLILTYGT